MPRTAAAKLTDPQIEANLATLPEWTEAAGAIQRTYQFKTFAESIAFVNKAADAAENADHHPDILIRYTKVTMTLSTHDAGGITKKDFDLAAKLDALAGR
jgi:4a-hydroxytetrahydrobiopterin dehydratase